MDKDKEKTWKGAIEYMLSDCLSKASLGLIEGRTILINCRFVSLFLKEHGLTKEEIKELTDKDEIIKCIKDNIKELEESGMPKGLMAEYNKKKHAIALNIVFPILNKRISMAG